LGLVADYIHRLQCEKEELSEELAVVEQKI
jgi:hypothetical protein